MNHLPNVDFNCLSDVEVEGIRTVPLMFGWQGWWSKMELFRPGISGDILFMDLDTSIVGDLTDIISANQLVVLRDIYRLEGLQSSIMYLPEAAREEIWAGWVGRPRHWMRIYRRGGDQAFLERFWLERASRWQDLLPGQVVSWKAHVRHALHDDETGKGSIPHGARVVIFHGDPRPWEIGW